MKVPTEPIQVLTKSIQIPSAKPPVVRRIVKGKNEEIVRLKLEIDKMKKFRPLLGEAVYLLRELINWKRFSMSTPKGRTMAGIVKRIEKALYG